MKTKLELYTDKAAFIEDLLELEELPTVVQVLLNEYKDILRNDSRNTPRETTRESILDGAKECVLFYWLVITSDLPDWLKFILLK